MFYLLFRKQSSFGLWLTESITLGIVNLAQRDASQECYCSLCIVMKFWLFYQNPLSKIQLDYSEKEQNLALTSGTILITCCLFISFIC